MKIEHWKQLKGFSQEELDTISNDRYDDKVHLVSPNGEWSIGEIWDIMYGGKLKDDHEDFYIKDIEKPTLPFVFNK